jgi:hypothetical protein
VSAAAALYEYKLACGGSLSIQNCACSMSSSLLIPIVALRLWKKLEVGDVVLLKENDQIPADVVVLSTSDSDGVVIRDHVRRLLRPARATER